METIKRTETYSLELVKEAESSITYKDAITEKYSYYKHTRKSNTVLFKHERAELKLINRNATKIRFLKRNAHDVNDFAAKFTIHIIHEPRPYKYYH